MGAEPPSPAQKATTLAGTTPQPTPGGGSRHREKILKARATAQALEIAAKKEVVQLQNATNAAKHVHVSLMARERVQQSADEMRAYQERIRKQPSGEPASKEEVQALSEQLNRKLCELIKDPRERTWFKLFGHVDDSGTRQISFKEFSAMIRDELHIAPKELPDRQIKAAWLALDKNGSGFISAGEFGGMMRRGEHVQAGFVEQKAPWQERVHSQRWQKAEEVRQTMDRLFHRDLKASMAGAPRATPEELYELSVALNKKMHELQQKKDAGVPIVDPRTDTGAASGTAAIGRDTGNAYTGTVAWFKLFRHMDDDGSGQISYVEFSGMIREELLITPSDIPERRLKAAWLALDTDCSGLINSGEFGAFMRLAEPPPPKCGDGSIGAAAKNKVIATKRKQGHAVRREMARRRCAHLFKGAPPPLVHRCLACVRCRPLKWRRRPPRPLPRLVGLCAGRQGRHRAREQGRSASALDDAQPQECQVARGPSLVRPVQVDG